MTTPPIIFTYNDGSHLYQVSAKWFLNISVWEGNRTMDEAHVSDLITTIADPRSLQGPYSVVTYTAETDATPVNRIIDGQHRQEVLRRYFASATAEPADFTVLVRRYYIADHAAAVALFQQINHAKPMVYRGSPAERLHEIVAALRKQFIHERAGGTLQAMIRTGCNRPCLNTEHLEEALKRYGIPDKSDITPAVVVEHAIKMNGLYAEDIARCPARFTRAMHERADEYGFYLGLDLKCAWLAGLL